jgi:hypothetical protein
MRRTGFVIPLIWLCVSVGDAAVIYDISNGLSLFLLESGASHVARKATITARMALFVVGSSRGSLESLRG